MPSLIREEVYYLWFRSVREIFLTVDGYAWSVPSVQSTMRYRESQVSLAVVDRAFTPGGVDYADSSIITAYFIFRVLNIRGWSQPQIILTAKFFPIYGSGSLR